MQDLGPSGAMLASRRQMVMIAGSVFAITTVALIVLGRLGVDAHHDGVLFKQARDVLAGQVPYRDSFDQYGPVLPILQAAFLGVLGQTVFALKLSVAMFYGLSAALLVALWRRLMPLWMAVGLWGLWLVMQPEISTQLEMLPWSSVYALAFSAAGSLLLCAALSRPDSTWCAISGGVMVGLAFGMRLPVGVLTAIALACALAATSVLLRVRVRRALAGFAAGFTLTIAVTLLWLVVVGALGDFWEQSIVEPRRWAAGHHAGSIAIIRAEFMKMLPVSILVIALVALGGLAAERLGGSSNPRRNIGIALGGLVVATALAWALAWDWFLQWASLQGVLLWSAIVTLCVGIALVLAVITVISRRVARRNGGASGSTVGWVPLALPAITALSLSALPQLYPVYESRHIYWAATPALGVLAWVIFIAARRQVLVIVGLAAIFLIPGIVTNVKGAYDRATSAWVSSPVPFGALDGMRLSQSFVDYYGGMMRALADAYAKRPDAPILNMGNDGLWNALGENVENADPYFVAWPVVGNPAARAEFIYREKPIIWYEHPDRNLPVRSYAAALGYRVAHHEAPTAPGQLDRWLLVPGPVVRKPPYLWRAEWGPVVGPAMMWASWGQR